MRRRPHGFTLIEALAATVLVAIVLPVVMHGFSIATSLSGAAQRKAEAATLAHSVLNELVVTREWQRGVLSGDFGEEHPEYRWEAELLDWDSSALQQMNVHVIWKSGVSEQSITLTTLVNTESN
ncbi:MAG TPA: type II secretion system protein, partial [Planctomycetota bacterium]|nr:type II secretion system protein [Planctomycetota bacterium]